MSYPFFAVLQQQFGDRCDIAGALPLARLSLYYL